ncbi:anti-sigma factor RsbA family regulatory protein [Geodermatophilus marinus]|uniref:anti-sigma factor RsbA family regulatory protein n=1 Tax=Geodermatophilus sp. LHW52908 TaxID=2303986 RepID=UPI000E3B7D8B|nr:anti-sigma factor RsbA family regulatory protein [Geodermatophilus sp. LHW52908]RFU21648.1 sensor histidine kinase [Geodermatophilus sp. LHW52908]
MTEVRPTGDWDGGGLAHEAFAFRTDRELTDRVVPFVLEGFSRGEPVLLVAGERVRTLVAEELGADVCRLARVAAAESWWQGGHRTLHAYARDLRALRATVPNWRLAAEPVWLARDDGREWSRFEAVANHCFTAMPYYSLCLHDRQLLPAPVLDAVERTHPLTWGGTAPVPTPAYDDPRCFLRSAQPAMGEQPASAGTVPVTTPREARRAVAAAVADWWPARLGDVVPAVHELVVNALRVAAFAEVSCWTEAGTLVVQVADAGPGLPDETLGYVPPADEPRSSRGMWLAWSLADDAALDSGPAGTTIRLFFRR